MRWRTLGAALAVLAAGCGGGGAAGEGLTIDVEMSARSGSGEDGTATLTAVGEQTRIVVELNNAPAQPQPAHLHTGTCETLTPRPEHPLEPVVDGRSETLLDVPLVDLQESAYALNVHRSEQDVETYVSCGDIAY